MSSPFDEPRWSVLFYGDEFLAHGVTLEESLQCVLEGLSEPFVDQGIQRYLSLFTISSEPRYFVEQEGDFLHDHFIAYALADQLIEDGGVISDIRDEIAANPALNFNRAADSVYELFRNIDLCATSYCDLPVLSNWPEDRINYLEEFDPLLLQHLIRVYTTELASKKSVHAVLDKTNLTHLDELHMWSFQQLFYFYACELGSYEGLEGKYGFEDSAYKDRILLSWGCAPHAHEMAYGIAFDIADVPPLEDPPQFMPAFTMSAQFLSQLKALLP